MRRALAQAPQAPVEHITHIFNDSGSLSGCLFIFPNETLHFHVDAGRAGATAAFHACIVENQVWSGARLSDRAGAIVAI